MHCWFLSATGEGRSCSVPTQDRHDKQVMLVVMSNNFRMNVNSYDLRVLVIIHRTSNFLATLLICH